MAATEVTLRADYNGKPLEVLQDIIVKRQAALCETTVASVVATAINILKSVRTETKVAKVGRGEAINVAESENLQAGWRNDGGKGRRCIRYKGEGAVAMTRGFINLMGAYHKGESPHVYVGVEQERDDLRSTRSYFIVAKSLEAAIAWMKKNRDSRIKRYGGMARWTVGRAMYEIASAQAGKDTENCSSIAKSVGKNNLVAILDESGFASGSVTVHVEDNLRYAMSALKGGASSFELALMKAANKTAGLIHQAAGDKAFDEDYVTPFPEVKRRR